MIHYTFENFDGAKFEPKCPILPSADKWVQARLKPVVGQLRWTLRNDHGNLDVLKRLQATLPTDLCRYILSEFLFFYLQRGAGSNRKAFSERSRTILELDPKAACARDEDGMTSLHYFCMREHLWPGDNADSRSAEMFLLDQLLAASPEAPMLLNNFGESPLHRLCSQRFLDAEVLCKIARTCPQSMRLPSSTGKLPLHIMMAETYKGVAEYEDSYLNAVLCVVRAFPEAAHTKIEENRVVLRIGGGSDGNSRRKKTWSPFSRAVEDGNLKAALIMEKYTLLLGCEHLYSCCRQKATLST